VSWNAATTRTTDLVLTCLRMGRWDRTRQGLVLPDGLIHHHDAGSQYTALRFTEHLALESMAPSIGSVGDAYDNCLMESIIGLYKTECIRPGPFVKGPLKTVSDVEYSTMAWVDWYNTRRLHSSLGNVPPAEFEAAHTIRSLRPGRRRSPYEDGRKVETVQPGLGRMGDGGKGRISCNSRLRL
jgi:putative transposase